MTESSDGYKSTFETGIYFFIEHPLKQVRARVWRICTALNDKQRNWMPDKTINREIINSVIIAERRN